MESQEIRLIYMQAIYILWLRQLKRYWRSKSRMIGSLGQPLLFLVALGFGFGPIYQKAGGGSYIEFLVPGIIAMSVIFTAIFSGIEIIWDRRFGFLKETLVAPVSRLSIMLGRTLGGATVATLQGCVVFVLSMIIGFRPVSWAFSLAALGFVFITAVLFTALGTAIASVLEDMQGFQLIMNFLVMPLFFLSGALFPLQGLPGPIRIVTYFDPLSYGVDGLQGALIGHSRYSMGFDFMVLAAITVLLVALGAYLFSRIEA
ncbi:MAG: ABC transporter, permease protein [Parcubacteria group bacterium GW2011_GWA2_43_9b]|nr:MAG: ABC transporter, permease protein [Parcubacteria group bacterium GW2011_GWA2_43_9b]